MGRMPTAAELRARGRGGLAAAVGRLDGYRAWAEKIGAKQKAGAVHWGVSWEIYEAAWFRAQGRIVVEQATLAPFDLLVDGKRVDVKAARRTQMGYVFVGIKEGRDADFFDLVCVNETDRVKHRFMVPAESARVHTITITDRTIAGAGRYARFEVTA